MGKVTFIENDLNSSPDCPIDYQNRTFNMTQYGGSANHIFADEQEFENFFEAATDKDWVFDSTNCSWSALHYSNETISLGLPICKSCDLDYDDAARTLRFDDLISNPSNSGHFVSSVYDLEDNLIAKFASGSLYKVSEHYSTGESIPLMPGNYKVKSYSKKCVCENDLVISPYNICTDFIRQKYNGPTAGPGANPSYKIPVSSNMTNLDLWWATQHTPDRIILKYNGNIIHDSGLVSTGLSADYNRIPFSYISGVEWIEVEVLANPLAGADTIWTFGLGCCPTRSCSAPIPKRDLLVNKVLSGTNGTVQWHTQMPYTGKSVYYSSVSGSFSIRKTGGPENSYTQKISDPDFAGCVAGSNNFAATKELSWIYQSSTPKFLYLPGGCNTVTKFTDYTCFDVADGSNPMNAYETAPGSKIVHLDFGNSSYYNTFKNKLKPQIDSFLATELISFNPRIKREVCSSDQPVGYAHLIGFYKDWINFDDTNNRVVIDYSSYTFDPTSCEKTLYPSSGSTESIVNWQIERWKTYSSAKGNFSYGLSTKYPLPYVRSKQTLVMRSDCGGSFEQEYNLYFNSSDPENTWELYRGDNLSGTKIQDYATFNPELTQNVNVGIVNRTNYIAVQNMNGWNIDCTDIDFSKPFNLTGIDSLATQTSFTDGISIATYLTSITGKTWKWDINFCMPYETTTVLPFDANSIHPIN